MYKKLLLIFIAIIALQSCAVYIPVTRDYQGYSKSLVFDHKKKWLINNIYTDLGGEKQDYLTKEIYNVFEKLNDGNTFLIDDAKKDNLLTSKISFAPSLTEIETIKNSTDFDYLVNSYTEKVRDQIASMEIGLPDTYKKNEAFAIVEVYDIKSMKRIYYQKISSSTSLESKDTFPDTNSLNDSQYKRNIKNNNTPYFQKSAGQLSQKNLKKILQDIQKSAIKIDK